MSSLDALFRLLAPHAGAILIQTSLLLLTGLAAGKLLAGRNPGARVTIYRAALAAAGLTLPVSLLAAGRAPAVWRLAPQSPAAITRQPLPPKTGAPVARISSSFGAVVPLPASNPPAPPVVTQVQAGPSLSLPLVLGGSWAVGSLGLLSWLLAGYLRLTRLRRQAEDVEDPAVISILAELRAGEPVRVVSSPEVAGPLLAGVLRPAIYLPGSYREDFDAPALRAILAHELAHLERRDCEWNLVARVLCALCWPQPLLWVLCRQIEQASEEACDAAVVAADISPTLYARCLVDLADRLVPARLDRTVGASVVPLRSSLGRRVEQILSATLRAPLALGWKARGIVALGTLALIGAACLLVTASGAAPTQKNAERPMITPPLKPEECALLGQVVDEKGRAVPDASVFVVIRDGLTSRAFGEPINDLAFVKTDERGYYAARGLRDGTYYVTVDDPKKERVAARVTIELVRGEVKEAPNLRLGPGGWVEGTLLDAATGRPVEGVHIGGVSADRPKGSIPDLDAVTDTAGRFRFRVAPGPAEVWPIGPADGEPDLRAPSSTFRDPLPGAPRAAARVVEGQASTVTLKVDGKRYGGGTLTGRLVFEDGKPAAAYEVLCQQREGNLSRWHGDHTRTAADGSFRLSGLGAGPYNVMVIDDSGEWVATAIDGAEAKLRETRPLPDLVLTRGGFVEGLVVEDGTGKPLADVHVGCYGPARPRTSAAIIGAMTDQNGKYRMRVAPGLNYLYLPDGKYIGKTDDPREGGQDILVKAGETRSLSFRAIPRPRRGIQPVAYQEPREQQRDAVAEGERLFRAEGCSGCHGRNSSVRAPVLRGLYDRKVWVRIPRRGVPLERRPAVTFTADERYLRNSILRPEAEVSLGYKPIMPSYRNRLTEQEVSDLVAYLRSLTPGAVPITKEAAHKTHSASFRITL